MCLNIELFHSERLSIGYIKIQGNDSPADALLQKIKVLHLSVYHRIIFFVR